MHIGDRGFAVHWITALSNVHDSYSLAISWEATICSTMVTQNKSDKLIFWSILRCHISHSTFFVASSVVWCLHNVSMIILKQQVLEGSWTIFDAAYIVCYSFLLTLVSYLTLSHPTSFHFNGCLERQHRLFFCITAWAHVHLASAYVLHTLLLKYVIVLRCLMSHCWVMCAFNMSIFMPYNCKLQVICQKIKKINTAVPTRVMYF